MEIHQRLGREGIADINRNQMGLFPGYHVPTEIYPSELPEITVQQKPAGGASITRIAEISSEQCETFHIRVSEVECCRL
jgi:hypothetical protein